MKNLPTLTLTIRSTTKSCSSTGCCANWPAPARETMKKSFRASSRPVPSMTMMIIKALTNRRTRSPAEFLREGKRARDGHVACSCSALPRAWHSVFRLALISSLARALRLHMRKLAPVAKGMRKSRRLPNAKLESRRKSPPGQAIARRIKLCSLWPIRIKLSSARGP